MDFSHFESPSHVARAASPSSPDDSGHLVAEHQVSKHIGALPIVLITIGTCIFIGVLAMVIYPAVCERLFGRPSPVRSRRETASLWHSPAYVNWGTTPFFRRPTKESDLSPSQPTWPHRKTKSLDMSSRASSTLFAAGLATSLSEKNILPSALYSDMTDSRLYGHASARPDSAFQLDLGSIFMATFQQRFSVGNESADSKGSTRGIAPASLPYSPRSETWRNSVATADIRTLYSQRFSRDSVYSQDAPGAPASTDDSDASGLAAPTFTDPDNNRNSSIRYSTESFLTVPGWHILRQATVVDDPEAQQASVYF
ncbi:unnamed protein product [Peniophora sp. CBMAI 1063]|nr:unnamed protein product [Peniophora sp. CBMAI 1063]